MDLNRNGKDDWKEVRDWFHGLLDVNKDGHVNKADLGKFVEILLDKNGDKKFTEEDVLAVLKELESEEAKLIADVLELLKKKPKALSNVGNLFVAVAKCCK